MTYFITSVSVPDSLSKAAWAITTKMPYDTLLSHVGYISVDSSTLSAYGMYWAKIIYHRDDKYLLVKSLDDIEMISTEEYSDFIHNNIIQPITDEEVFYQAMMNGDSWMENVSDGKLLGYIKDIGNNSVFKDRLSNCVCPVFSTQTAQPSLRIYYSRYVNRLVVI